ncbi:MAG: hypothetical protein HKN41_03340 [Ilumatobacter sp.]|nr:hypothetical protein [Ilumatobacter sp.]
MAWDSSRPVPWQRLIREWLLYVAVMAVLFVVFFRDDNLVGIFAGLLISGPLYLAFGFVLAKFGYSRKSWKELRAEPRRGKAPKESSDAGVAGPRPKPPPTSRTGGGRQRPGGSRRRR